MADSPDSSDSDPGRCPTPNYRNQLLFFSANDRIDTVQSLLRGEFDLLRGAASNRLWFISDGYSRERRPAEVYEIVLHDLWHMYYEGGKRLSHSSAEQDRLAFDILRARGLGLLTRPARSNNADQLEDEVAITSGGRLWDDLPFFVTDMTEFWINDYATMGGSHRVNFAHFLAKLAATGLDNDRLCHIALLIFRETFETGRPIGSLSDCDDASPHTTTNDLSVAALLPVAHAWLKEAGDKILQLSISSWNDCPGTIGQCGTTFTNSKRGYGSSPSGGFSPWRWLYWHQRLEEIVQEAKGLGDDGLVEMASYSLALMGARVQTLDSPILTELEAMGEFVQDGDGEVFQRFPSSN